MSDFFIKLMDVWKVVLNQKTLIFLNFKSDTTRIMTIYE
ncbi:hypothetical protein N175_09400 [Vibrio anguillarum M3]|nr:hypothetical protein N175_09400 [Vibrio anguillarum M3]